MQHGPSAIGEHRTLPPRTRERFEEYLNATEGGGTFSDKKTSVLSECFPDAPGRNCNNGLTDSVLTCSRELRTRGIVLTSVRRPFND